MIWYPLSSVCSQASTVQDQNFYCVKSFYLSRANHVKVQRVQWQELRMIRYHSLLNYWAVLPPSSSMSENVIHYRLPKGKHNQRELFLSGVNNRETIAAINTYCLQNRIEKLPLEQSVYVWHEVQNLHFRISVSCVICRQMLRLHSTVFSSEQTRC